MAGMISYEQLLEGAAAQSGTKDFGDEALFGPSLRRLINAIQEEACAPQLRLFGFATQVVSQLATRARITAFVARHPEVRDVPIERPIFIVGLPRTGTTLLHNLLADHPRHRSPRLWEMRSPVRPDGADGADGANAAWEANAVKETQSVLDLLYSTAPEMRQIHSMNATWPDECSWLFRHSFASMVYGFQFPIPGYASWLCETDMAPYYEHYRLQLQILSWRKTTGRLVLKDPCHLWHLPTLFQVFPDAEVVMLHRPLEQALPSMASLCHALHRIGSESIEEAKTGAYTLDLAEHGLLPAMWYQKAVDSRQITNVSYRELVADPMAAVQRICAAVGTETNADDVTAMRRWLEGHPQHSRGRHEYTLEQYGMARALVAKRFGRYEETYLST